MSWAAPRPATEGDHPTQPRRAPQEPRGRPVLLVRLRPRLAPHRHPGGRQSESPRRRPRMGCQRKPRRGGAEALMARRLGAALPLADLTAVVMAGGYGYTYASRGRICLSATRRALRREGQSVTRWLLALARLHRQGRIREDQRGRPVNICSVRPSLQLREVRRPDSYRPAHRPSMPCPALREPRAPRNRLEQRQRHEGRGADGHAFPQREVRARP